MKGSRVYGALCADHSRAPSTVGHFECEVGVGGSHLRGRGGRSRGAARWEECGKRVNVGTPF